MSEQEFYINNNKHSGRGVMSRVRGLLCLLLSSIVLLHVAAGMFGLEWMACSVQACMISSANGDREIDLILV